MAAEVELERMVVRLLGDGSDYKKMLDQAQQSSQQAAQQVEAASKRIEGMSNGLQGFASAATSALAAMGLGGLLQRAFGEFTTMEDTAIGLTAALEANGRAVEPLRARYQAFASDIQNITTVGDDTTLAMLEQIELMGLTGDAAERAARNAIALAKGNGELAPSFVRIAAALEEGNTDMLMRQLPANIRAIEDETQRAAAAQNYLASQFSVAQAKAQSASGQIAQLKNAFGDFLEEIGAVVADGIKPLVTWLGEAVRWLQALSPETKKYITIALALVTAVAGLGPVLSIVQTLLGGVAGALGKVGMLASLAFSPIGIAIGLAVAAIAIFVQNTGGISAAFEQVSAVVGVVWDWITERAAEFMEWIQPLLDALVGFFQSAWWGISTIVVTVWNTIKSVITTVVGFVTGILDSMGVDIGAVFTDIRDTAILVLDFMSFTFENFGQVAGYVWTSIQLAAVVVFDWLRVAFVTVAGVASGSFQAILATISAIWQNIRAGAERLFNFLRAGFSAIGSALSAAFRLRNPLTAFRESFSRELNRLNSESTGFRNVGEAASTAYREGFASTTSALGGTDPSDLQTRLRAQWEAEGRALGQSFEEWRAARATAGEVAVDEEGAAAEGRAGAVGSNIGRSMTRGIEKETKKLDAVLVGSADSIARINEFAEKVMSMSSGRPASGRPTTVGSTPTTSPAPAPTGSSIVPSSGPAVARPTSGPASGGDAAILGVLRSINGHLANLAGRPGVTITGASIS